MSGLILPNEWTRQPQTPVGIDWGNPLAKGLRAAVSGISAYDFVTNKFLTVSGAFTKTATPYGVAHTTTAAADSTYIELPFEISGAVSVVTVVSRDVSATTTGTGKVAPVITNRTANQANFWEFNLGNGFGALGDIDKPRLSNNSAGFGTIYADGVALSGNNPATTALTNGRFYTLAAVAASGATASGSGKMWLFATLTGSYFSLVGRMPLALVYDRALSAAEVKSLSDNPWQIFKSQSRRIWVVGAGGGISLSLTGQSLTANLGALSASVTSSVTGNQTTLQQGTITANVSQTLTGQAISLVQGSVSSDVSTVITGQTVSLAQGSVTDASSGDVTKALSGQSLSVSQGALTASISLALNGQSIVLSGGSVSPAISSALAGQQASVQQGNVSANISAGLTGQAVVLSNGTVAQAGSDVTKALTGQQLSIALGVLLEKKTIARPSSDTTAGAWLPSAGSSLYATLDEVSPDDADYIYTNSVSTCKIALNAVADPLTSSGQIVSYRVWSPNSNGLTVRLMQGATEIASWTHTVLPTSPTTYQQTLTAGQCDAITDYSTLAIQLESV